MDEPPPLLIEGALSVEVKPTCNHNTWEKQSKKKRSITLKCRTCNAFWKTRLCYFEKCVDFYHGNCMKGDQCPHPHIFSKACVKHATQQAAPVAIENDQLQAIPLQRQVVPSFQLQFQPAFQQAVFVPGQHQQAVPLQPPLQYQLLQFQQPQQQQSIALPAGHAVGDVSQFQHLQLLANTTPEVGTRANVPLIN